MMYGIEVEDVGRDNRQKPFSIELIRLRRSGRRCKLERIRNNEIRQMIGTKRNIVDDVEKTIDQSSI